MSKDEEKKEQASAKRTIQFLMETLAPFKSRIFVPAFFAVLSSVMQVIIPLMYGRAIDGAINRTSFSSVILFLVAWFVLSSLGSYFRRIVSSRAGLMSEEASFRFVQKVFGTLFYLPMSFHFNKRRGDITSQVGRVRWVLRNVLEGGIFELVPAALTVVAISAYLFVIEWRIALVLIFTLFLLAFVTRRNAKKTLDTAIELYDKQDKRWEGRLWDALRNILIVKSTTNEARERKMLSSAWSYVGPSVVKYVKAERKNKQEQDLVNTLGALALFSFGVHSLWFGIITPGVFTAIMGYFFLVLNMTALLIWQVRSLVELSATLPGLDELIRETPEDYTGGKKIEIQGEVEFSDVHFQYRKKVPVLRGINFKVKKGETVALVGLSGQGKTTIVELLAHYLDPKSGVIKVDGMDVKDINLLSLRSQMAYVPQDLTLFHDSIFMNIQYGRPGAKESEVIKAAKEARIYDFIKKLPEGYETKVGERGLKLSAGERQRVAIARAFLRSPKILILDEPTSSVDAKTEELLRESLRKLTAGRTTFIIAHRLRTIREADHIMVLDGGKIVEEGTHEELDKKGGRYKELLDLQLTL